MNVTQTQAASGLPVWLIAVMFGGAPLTIAAAFLCVSWFRDTPAEARRQVRTLRAASIIFAALTVALPVGGTVAGASRHSAEFSVSGKVTGIVGVVDIFPHSGASADVFFDDAPVAQARLFTQASINTGAIADHEITLTNCTLDANQYRCTGVASGTRE